MKMDNTRKIAYNIFTEPVKEKCSILLRLENYIDYDELQSILSMITAHGVDFLYPNKTIFQLGFDEFLNLQQYVNSFGYEIIKKKNYK